MREKFLCQSASPRNGVSKALLVFNGENDKLKPDYININSSLDEYRVGDIWEFTTKLIYRAGDNGVEQKP